MRLFSEKVTPIFTNSNINILTVKDYEEVFFDVYEFEVNGKTFVAEKVASHNSNPVVNCFGNTLDRNIKTSSISANGSASTNTCSSHRWATSRSGKTPT